MKLFVDENLPPQLARGLAVLFKGDHEVTCHRDKFDQRCRLDEEWVPELGREGEWVVLSGDVNIARKRPQRELFFRANLVGFFPRGCDGTALAEEGGEGAQRLGSNGRHRS